MEKITKVEWVSNCCSAHVEEIYGDEGTAWAKCSQCKEPCTPVREEARVMEATRLGAEDQKDKQIAFYEKELKGKEALIAGLNKQIVELQENIAAGL